MQHIVLVFLLFGVLAQMLGVFFINTNLSAAGWMLACGFFSCSTAAVLLLVCVLTEDDL